MITLMMRLVGSDLQFNQPPCLLRRHILITERPFDCGASEHVIGEGMVLEQFDKLSQTRVRRDLDHVKPTLSQIRPFGT
ncbi:hypothetical protein ABIB75_008096 [Bradyrhizobium sp. GM2.2]|uniref:hypothetical protein n=1 Tax=Bradyrhizobium sp. GM2.2 TaxID=3156358 RepID=UPI00339741CD